MSHLPIFIFIYCLTVVKATPKIKHCNDTNESVNGVGTVLFTPADVYKQCWSLEEIAILTTRMILEDLLPDVTVFNIDSNAFVDDIVSYFRLLIEVVKTATTGRKKRVTLLALTDLLGGYLQYAVLPLARYAFYAGLIDYTSMEKLIQLFEEIKWFLRTNGQGWPKPMTTTPVLTIEPINFETETPKIPSCCSQLFYTESEQNSQSENNNATVVTTEITFPLPFFDSRVRPSAIAVPFKRFTLRNIESRRASHIILKFFIASTKCFKEKKSSKATTLKFHNSFFGWLRRDVLTKIEDDKFYSAFGGILRIEETLKAMGAVDEGENTCIPEGEQEIVVPEAGVSHKHFTSSIILIVMLAIILLWFIIGTVFICLRMRRSQKKQDEKDQTKSRPTSSSSLETSKWSLFSKSKSDQSVEGKCKCSSKTSAFSTSYTSDYDLEEKIKKRKQKQRNKAVTICYPPYLEPYMEKNRPAVIDTQTTTMKKLPSIEEISEVTTENRSLPRKLGADNTGHIKEQSRKHATTTSVQNIRYGSRCPNININGASSSKSKLRKNKQPSGGMIIDECWCDILHAEDGEIESVTLDESFPGVEDDMKRVQQRGSADKTRVDDRNSTRKSSQEDNTNYAKGMVVQKHSSTEKSRSGEMPRILSVTFSGETDQSGQKFGEPVQDSHAAFDSRYGANPDDHVQRNHEHTVADLSYEHFRPEESTAEETSEANTDKERISTHHNACHSSLTGTYARQMKDGKPFIFGYDLETSSSSELSEEETDLKTSTSK
ncbi:uncharacterized protein [Diabrotica undecimpunctata]|uniref:uncharacterized protein isoform X1 n=1 Tax=Diabrotica undecimpunctata TaxID=50387 RepID=UPI003B63CF19